ncbi:MAG: efflux RND transporter periplasmic adaptor subunit [Oligoflexia bacterium]|nr:efflux RND transporter periplasmic adaptor subunit [Oligoflexia bacterium]
MKRVQLVPFGIPLVLLLTACGAKTVVKGAKAVLTSVETSVTTTSAGTVIAEQQAVLGFGATGRIARILVSAGAKVRKGQLLAELENTDLRTVFEDSERELKRASQLFAEGLVSSAALDEARRNREIARANYDKSVIRAPFEGVITEMNLELGELSQAGALSSGKAPMRIADNRPRRVRGDIDEVDLSRVKSGTPARVKIQALGPDWIPAVVDKVVAFVSTVKEKDRTSEIELKFTGSGTERIPVGASADIELITETKESALAVPARVVLGTGGQRYVYVHEDDRVRKRAIKTGLGNYVRMEVVSGLNAGEVVVYPPNDLDLKDGMKAKLELTPWP